MNSVQGHTIAPRSADASPPTQATVKGGIFVPATMTALTLVLGAAVYLRVVSERLNLTTGLLFMTAVSVGILALVETAFRLLNASAQTRARADSGRIDGHNNSKGYAAFGEVVANEILRKGLMTGE